MEIAKAIAQSLADRVVIGKVDGEVWDLERPLEKSCSLELLTFDDPEGRSPKNTDRLNFLNFYIQVNVYSGIRLLTFWVRLQSVTTDAIFALVLLPTKVSSTKWPSQTGGHFPDVLCFSLLNECHTIVGQS